MAGTGRSTRPETGNSMGRRNRHVHNGEEYGSDDDEDDGNRKAVGSADGGTPEPGNKKDDGGSAGGRSWCLGRTLLVEAKVLINGPKNDRKQANSQGVQRGGGARRRRIKAGLRFLSLDGLVRQRKGGVQKTLRGFVVQASLGNGGSKISSTSVDIPAVQSYLENAALGAAGDGLEAFREARPLDDRGNYRELNALLGRAGRRALYEALLASCRVLTSADGEGRIGVQLLRVNADGAGMTATATATAAGTGAHIRSKPRGGAIRSVGSSVATERGIEDPAASHGLGGGSRVVPTRRGGDKNSPIVVRIPPATSGPATSPKTPCKDASESGGEEQEGEEEEEEEEDSDID